MGTVKHRDYFYDNAKFILIFLVVLGHCIEPFIGANAILGGIFGFIYMFHMPAFIFISGYFTKKGFNKREIIKLILDYFVMFVIVQLLFVAFTKVIGLRQYSFITITPAYIYWYLFAMFAWSMALKIAIFIFEYIGFKIEYLIGLSFILGLIVGYLDCISWELSLSRIIVFFPFFVLGYYFRTKGIKINDLIRSKILSVCIMFIGIWAAFTFNNIFNFGLLSCADSYNGIGLDKYGMLYRIVIYTMQTLMMITFFSLISKEKTYFTSIGCRTLNVYILHGFIIKLMVALSYFESINLLKVFLLPVFAILIVVTFSKIPLNMKLSSLNF